ncbi:hypothetical protein D3C83_76450 [compost metagenome]
MGHIAQAEGDAHAVETIVWKRQFFGIALRDRYDHPGIEQSVAADSEHRRVDVGQHDFAARADPARKEPGQIGGAAGDVEHPVTGPNLALFHGEALP